MSGTDTKGAATIDRRFMAVASKTQAAAAGELAADIKAAVFRYGGQIPLALAIGVLRIVEKELLDEQR